MEWLLLVVLVPAVIVPIVLLFGFTGCASLLDLDDVTYAAPDPATNAPTNLRATDIQETVITIAWDHDKASLLEFVISREDAINGKIDEFAKVGKGLATSFTDTGGGKNLPVVPGTDYKYWVTALNPDTKKLSAPSNALAVRSLKWEVAYDNPVAITDPTNLAGQCLVQRIDHTIYQNFGGTSVKQVRLVLTGVVNPVTNTLFTNVTVSHAAPAVQAPEAFDSEVLDSEGKPVQPVPFGPVTLPNNGQQRAVGPVDFPLDRKRDLIVAFDIDPTNANRLRARQGVGASQAFAGAGAQAANADRNGLAARPGAGVYVIEKIEVLTA